ncbi:Protein kinase domain-containing protein [Mycena chlorophos]|uniref:Protein kinase domain-containing protein n=1 Tax=Mycena chlorophos TaxID=658473 RepID=A0A8H6WIL5_MYCCL|nr:Protein kinase domain-containing protein [Mycena chlorophos]
MSDDVEGLSSFEKLFPKEEYWRNHYEWLKGCGYELRPRFRPGWVPSWKLDPTKTAMLCPDAWSPFNPAIMDARRLSDGSNVVLKKVDQFLHPFELEISEFFTGLGKSRENHCIPLLGTLRPPNEANLVILVLPYLRAYNSPRFDTFGEAVELFRQLFEGLQFMHRHNVAHRDNHSLNLLMDGVHLYPHGFQPDILHQDLKLGDKYGSASHTTRTWKPVKYYFADFGISRQYSASQREEGILDTFIMGGDKSPPEHQGKYSKVDPFATDIYFLGNFIKTSFVERDETVRTVGFRGFEFMTGLVADMTQEDPAKRPNIDEAVARFAEIQKSLSSWKLRSRVVSQKEGFFRLDRVIMHWSRRVRSFVFRRPAIPTPPE